MKTCPSNTIGRRRLSSSTGGAYLISKEENEWTSSYAPDRRTALIGMNSIQKSASCVDTKTATESATTGLSRKIHKIATSFHNSPVHTTSCKVPTMDKSYTSLYEFMASPNQLEESALLEAFDQLLWRWSQHRNEKLTNSTLYYQNLGHMIGTLVKDPINSTSTIDLLTVLEAAFQEIGALQCAEIVNRWRRAKTYAYHHPQEDKEGLFVDEGVEL